MPHLSHGRRIPAVFIAFALTNVLVHGALAAPPAPEPSALERNKYVEPTNWGDVGGRIYDASTGAPLEGATVTIWEDGVFADKGRTIGRTDAWGCFSCQALLGRVSSNVDAKRLLVNLFSPIPGAGISQHTTRIDVSRLTIRVQKDGYTLFEGIAPCRELDPVNFRVNLEPVLLSPTATGEASAVAGGWGAVRIDSVRIDPELVRPGNKATVIARVVWPAQKDPKDLTLRVQSPLIGNKELKREKERDAGGDLVYTATFDVPRKAHTLAQMVTVSIERSMLDVAKQGARKRGLLQVIDADADANAGLARGAAYETYVAGHTTDAVTAFKSLCGGTDPLPFDLLSLGELATETRDTATATYAYSRFKDVVQKEDEPLRMAASGRYARALLSDGKAREAFNEADTAIRSVPEKERRRRVPPELLVVAGEAATQAGDLGRASELRQTLSDWDVTTATAPGLASFLNGLRLAETRQKVSASPDNAAAHAELGRVLLDQQRYAEAVTELQTADKLTPGLPSVRRDITYALLNLQGGAAKARPNLDDAIADAQASAEIPDPKNPTRTFPSKDFWAWYPLGMLRYTKYRMLADAGDTAGAAAQMELCQRALVEALRCARTGAKVNEGAGNFLFGYMQDRTVSVAGFAYPQADGVFALRESLRVLADSPDNPQALLNLGTALLDLGYADLAAAPIARVVALSPAQLPDAQYASALVALKTGDRDTGITLLRGVVKSNPRNGAAWNTLARLYTEDGDTVAASECLTAYARIFGPQEVAPTGDEQ